MSQGENRETINRLCSEIQLFDLCELDNCSSRTGKYCTDPELLARFESIQEEDDRPLIGGSDDDELDDDSELTDDYDESEFDESDEE